MLTRAVRQRTVPLLIAAATVMTGLACGPEGATAPITSYPCEVGWSLSLLARDPVRDYYYEALGEVSPTAARSSLVEIGDSVAVALVRVDMTLDPSGTSCVGVETLVSSAWTLTPVDPAGVLSIAQPHSSAPAVVHALSVGAVRVRGIIGTDTIGPAWITAVPRVASLVITPTDTLDAGAAPVTVQIGGRDSVGQAVQIFASRTDWAVLGTSTLPVALWPSVVIVPQPHPNAASINATVTFPSTATVGTAQIRFRTRHASATLSVTVPPTP